MKSGNQHGTGDKRAEKTPASADVPKQTKVGSSSKDTRPLKAKKKRT